MSRRDYARGHNRAVQPVLPGAMSVTVDARVLGGEMDGTKRHVLELTGALARHPSLEVRALVRPDLDPGTRERLSAAGAQLTTGGFASDVVHRPHQVDSPADLAVLGALGRRLLVTHQDLIAWGSPAQFASSQAWAGYRSLTRMALLSADRVVFPSAHVRDQALTEELVEPDRTSVVALGVDHPLTAALAPSPTPPPGLTGRDGDMLMLCLGADYVHKNRPYAIEVAAALQQHHDWEGRLVLAGAHVPFGSTCEQEAKLLRADPHLSATCTDLGPVNEAERRWLLEHARLVIHPSAQEGFGLVPFEAAAHGTPCMWAAGTSLSELLPDEEAVVDLADPAATAERAAALLRDDAVRVRNLEAIREAAASLTWAATAEKLAEVYRRTLDEPASPGSVMLRHDGVMQPGFSEDAVRLVGPGGVLPSELERPLLALAGRRGLRAPLFAALRLGYRLGHRTTRGGPTRPGPN